MDSLDLQVLAQARDWFAQGRKVWWLIGALVLLAILNFMIR